MSIVDFVGKKFHFDASRWDKPERYTVLNLYQLGDLCCQSSFKTGSHVQVCYEISYIISGKGLFLLDKKEFHVGKGDIFLCLPGQEHDFVADREDPLRFYYLAFTFLESLNPESPFSDMEKMLCTVLHPLRQDECNVDAPFIALLNEFITPGELSSVLIETYMIQILLLTYRNFMGFTKRKSANSGDYKNKAVCEVISHIDNNIFHITGLMDIARQLNYSYSYLAHLFSTELGLSMQTYYNKRRIETAAALLEAGSMSINEIALSLQYQSIHSFSKAFKKTVGIAPSEYRASAKGKPNAQI